MSKLVVCLRHISEVYLYEYYCLCSDEYEISGNNTLTPHKEKAKELMLSWNFWRRRLVRKICLRFRRFSRITKFRQRLTL